MPDVDLAKHAAFCAINPPGDYLGPVIASAAIVTLSHPAHKITGAVAIDTINPPFPGFVGNCVLIPVGAFTFTTAGNIATTATAVPNRPLYMFYDGAVWFPHAIA